MYRLIQGFFKKIDPVQGIFLAIVLLFIGLFIQTRGEVPYNAELAFTERSVVEGTIGSVVPASCESGVYNGWAYNTGHSGSGGNNPYLFSGCSITTCWDGSLAAPQAGIGCPAAESPSVTATSANYPPGSYTFTVPSGVYAVTATVVGGGGGGGGAVHTGDAHSGSAGGSGGYTTQTVAVTPGQNITVTVGAGGCGGHGYWASYDWGGTCVGQPTTWAGGDGGSSSFGGLVATGGTGGTTAAGAYYWYALDPWVTNVGIGGSPNGVNGAGGPAWVCAAAAGGDNGSGYGTGGYGGPCAGGGRGQSGRVILSWTPSTPIVTTDGATPAAASATINGRGNPNGQNTTGYFRWGTTNTGSCATLANIATTSTALGSGSANVAFSASLTGLTPNTDYYYCAYATNGSGTGYGSIASFRTRLTSPAALTATPGACSTGAIGLSWNAVSGATSYTLRDGAIVIYTGATRSYNHTGLAGDSSHTYTVRAENVSTNSAYSAGVVGVAPSATCSVNGACSTNLNACTQGTLSDTADNATQYRWSCLGSGGGTNASCTITKPTGTVVAVPTDVNYNLTSKISWSSSNASSCTVYSLESGNTDSWNGLLNTGVSTTPLLSNTTYNLLCFVPGDVTGLSVAQVPVTVDTAPELRVSPRIVPPNESDNALIWWDTQQDETGCTIDGGEFSNDPLVDESGNAVSNIGTMRTTVTARTVFTLSCPNILDPTTPFTTTAEIEILSTGFES